MNEIPIKNLFNKGKVTSNSYIVPTSGRINTQSNFSVSDYIPVTPTTTYSKLNTGNYQVCYFNSAKVYLSGINFQSRLFTTPSNCYYIRITIYESKSTGIDSAMVLLGDIEHSDYIPYEPETFPDETSTNPGLEDATENTLNSDILKNDWKGRSWASYGDSITYLNQFSDGGWAHYVSDYFETANHYTRGVGGSTISFNTAYTFYCDEKGQTVSSSSSYDGIGHNCCFSSWDRIYTTLNKIDIDMIIIMGGTNDFAAGYSLGDLSFSSSNSFDTAWISSSYYNGGDYSIKSFKGGLASTVMKIQALKPNCRVILATPLSGRTNTAMVNMTAPQINRNGNTMEHFSNAVMEVGHFLSVPVIDIYGNTGINFFNSNQFIRDNTHPNTIAGKKAIASVIIGELKRILPRNF